MVFFQCEFLIYKWLMVQNSHLNVGLKMGHDWLPSSSLALIQAEAVDHSSLVFHSIGNFTILGEAHLQNWGLQSAWFNLPMQMPVLLRSTLKDTSRITFNWMAVHPWLHQSMICKFSSLHHGTIHISQLVSCAHFGQLALVNWMC